MEMSELSVLIELQSVHDNLRTIQRDLSAFPPDLAALDAELKMLARKIEETTKGLAASRSLFASLTVELGSAQKAEELAKVSVKGATQKVQYTAAIRELDERQRQKSAVARPVKETEYRIDSLERLEVDLRERQTEAQAQFDELKAIFLGEHENQVAAQAKLLARSQELEGALQPGLLVKFRRLLQQRSGRAVVSVDGGACGGCRTRLRTPVVAHLREAETMFCESCQRILYDPSRL
jgi:predicted  nucleic acid-binding Zn-ribbon protein